MFKILF